MNVAIIGAGAAGYFAAITLAQMRSDVQVTLYEATGKTLSKLLVSGGGRCNVTTSTVGAKELSVFYPRGSKELIGPFHRFESRDTVKWFEARGVQLITEADGRMFPSTHKSITVAKCLREEAEKYGVILRTHMSLSGISKDEREDNFKLRFKKSDEDFNATHVLLTTGGARGGHEMAQSLGHKIVSPVPSLFSFQIEDDLLKELQGVSFPNLKLELACEDGKCFPEHGPVLITHWGLSGPGIIRLSSLSARSLAASEYAATLTVNFLGDASLENIRNKLIECKNKHPKKKIVSHCPFELPKAFWQQLVQKSEPALLEKNYSDLSKKDIELVTNSLGAKKFKVTGKGRFKDEFVTCGGVKLSEVNFQTMESKVCPGLYFAGEVLDIDGLTGGYNFQCAWTTGWIAGQSIAESV